MVHCWDGPLRKGTLIIGVAGRIGGVLNASVGTNVETFTTSTWGVACGETSTAIGSMTGVLWEQIIPSCNSYD